MRSLGTPTAEVEINISLVTSLLEEQHPEEERIQRLETKTNLITPKIKNLWNQALTVPIDVPATWLHGDLHPRK